MEIGPTSLSLLSTALPSLGGGGATAGVPSGGFGPAALLSNLGQSQPDFAGLAGIYANRTAALAAPRPLTESEAAQTEAAFKLLEDNDIAGAKAALEELADSNPRNAAAAQGLGLVALAENDFVAAERHFRRADFLAPGRGSDVDADNARALQGDDKRIVDRARTLIASESTRGKGVQLLLKYTERRGDDAAAQLLLGEGLLAIGETDEGIARVLTAVDQADDALLGYIEKRFQRLVKLAPKRPDFHGIIGRVQRRLGRFDEAMASFDRADQLSEGGGFFNADRALIYAEIGREHLDRGDVSRAIATLEQAHQLDGENREIRAALAEGHLARADQKRRLGLPKQSVLDYREAAQLVGADGDESLRRRIAMAAFDAGLRIEQRHRATGEDLDEEVVAYQAAYDVAPENLTIKRRLAETRKTIGDQYAADEKFEQAVGAYERAHELYKNDSEYKSALVEGYRLLGTKYRSQNRYDEAIKTFTKAYKLDGNNEIIKGNLAEAYNARGVNFRNRQLFTKALADFKEALRLMPDNATYQSNYDDLASYDQ